MLLERFYFNLIADSPRRAGLERKATTFFIGSAENNSSDDVDSEDSSSIFCYSLCCSLSDSRLTSWIPFDLITFTLPE
jgi:hypothetical protein